MAAQNPFHLQDLLENPNRVIRIIRQTGSPNAGETSTSNELIKSYYKENLSLSVSNNWSDSSDSTTSSVINTTLSGFNKAINTGKDFANRYVGSDLTSTSSRTILSKRGSIVKWEGSSKPSFSVPLVFIATNESSNILEKANQLWEFVMPVRENKTDAFWLGAPMGYSNSLDQPKGLITIGIGKWFRATDLVVDSVNINYDFVTDVNGDPIYIEATLAVKPRALLTYSDYTSWFKGW